ncbi:Fc.00g040940.m01.CDS01 [Cosmosporella sp. VM-42]
MDFSGQYQFPGAQPYHQFMPIPPLTPSNSHSAGSDDFAATTSPPDGYEAQAIPQNPTDQFPNFDYSQGFNAANVGHQHQHPPTAFPGPPTPPNPSNHNVFAGQQQPPPSLPPPQQQQQQQHQLRHGSISNGIKPVPAPDMMSISQAEANMDDLGLGRGGSEEDDSLTPAQSRRKAQNRAAQRAFRERKEKHVKDLEAKLADLEAAQQQASVENERLKRDLQKMSTENEILRATSHMGGLKNSMSPEPTTTGPMKFNPTDFYSNVLQNHTNKSPSHRIVTSDEGERLLAAGATWEFIINHELFMKGLVDVGNVSERLKNCARCDGQGPVFSEQAILAAIEQSVASGSDDLL